MTAAIRTILSGLGLLAAVACSQGEAPRPAGETGTPEQAAPAAGEPTHIVPPQSSAAPAPIVTTDMSPTDSSPQCAAGLKAKGLTEDELRIMLGPMAGVCPNVGIDEARIRQILSTVWTGAGCTQHTPAEVLKTLESGACGGDAG